MAEWYYTDIWRQQYGPVEDKALLQLNRDGIIGADTHVWKNGLAGWEPFRAHAPELFKGENGDSNKDGDSLTLGVCAHSGRILEREEMIPYGEALIALDAKQEFVQSLMETGRTMVEDATETGVQYVGFWMRFLGVILDEMVKWVPHMVFSMIPSLVMAIGAGAGADEVTLGYLMMGSVFLSAFLTLAFLIFYETWMVGKYQGTVGKMVIGAKVVNPDGTKLTYWRSFFRWFAKNPVGYLISSLPPLLIFIFMMVAISSGFENSERPAIVGATVFFLMVISVLLTGVFSAVFWMAAFDPEKRALHDRIASTRVIKK